MSSNAKPAAKLLDVSTPGPVGPVIPEPTRITPV